jgi:hypothetical protein
MSARRMLDLTSTERGPGWTKVGLIVRLLLFMISSAWRGIGGNHQVQFLVLSSWVVVWKLTRRPDAWCGAPSRVSHAKDVHTRTRTNLARPRLHVGTKYPPFSSLISIIAVSGKEVVIGLVWGVVLNIARLLFYSASPSSMILH